MQNIASDLEWAPKFNPLCQVFAKSVKKCRIRFIKNKQ